MSRENAEIVSYKSFREIAVLTLLIIAWALVGAGLPLLRVEQPLPVALKLEILLGGLLIWAPWIAIVPLIRVLSRKFPVSEIDSLKPLLFHACFGLTIGLLHMAFIRLGRPLPEMVFQDVGYFEVFTRFNWADYFLNKRLLVDLLLYGFLVTFWTIRNGGPDPRKLTSQTEIASALQMTDSHPARRGKVMIRDGRRTVYLAPTEIEWIEANDYYTTVHADGVSYLQKRSLEKMQETLREHGFLRTHRSCLVNSRSIKCIDRSETDWKLILFSGAIVPVSRRKRREVSERLKVSLGN